MTDRDLALLRLDFVAGQLSMEELSARHNVPVSRIRDLALIKGWRRQPPATQDGASHTIAEILRMDPETHARLAVAEVVLCHRNDVARLRSLTNVIIERLALELSGEMEEILQQNPSSPIRPIRGSRESFTDVLSKLSQVMVRTTEIERQAYGLKTFSPEQEATDAETQQQLDELEARLEQVGAEKSSQGWQSKTPTTIEGSVVPETPTEG